MSAAEAARAVFDDSGSEFEADDSLIVARCQACSFYQYHAY